MWSMEALCLEVYKEIYNKIATYKHSIGGHYLVTLQLKEKLSL